VTQYLVKPFLYIPFLLLFAISANSQIDELNIELPKLTYESKKLIQNLEEQSRYSFIFNPNDVRKTISVKESSLSFSKILDRLLFQNELKFELKNNQIILIPKKQEKKQSLDRYTISGYIEDIASNERLIGAHLIESFSGKGTISNESGFFSLTISEGSFNLKTSYIGYKEIVLPIELKTDTTIIIALHSDIYLNEIEIIAEQKTVIEEATMSEIHFNNKQLKTKPSFLGEDDIIHTLQTLPGVSTSNSLNSGLIVRGGSQDQNLILLDGITLYNISHLLGLFSIFNSDIVKSTSLKKAAFPARYGGRLSSVLDIRMNDGDLKNIHGDISINLIASKFTIQGPIQKDKTSFVISGRRSYADIIAKPFIKKAENSSSRTIEPRFNFYDTYAKLQHIFSKRHRLILNFYKGEDRYGLATNTFRKFDENFVDWGNTMVGVRWNWELNKKLFLNTTVSYLNFDQNFIYSVDSNLNNRFMFKNTYNSFLSDYTLNFNFDYVPNLFHFIRFGMQAKIHQYNPGTSAIEETNNVVSVDTIVRRPIVSSSEFNAYVEDDLSIGKWKLNLGLHASLLAVQDVVYSSLQPRISAKYSVAKGLALKSSFSLMTQFNYLVTSESVATLSDFWVSSTSQIKPQDSWQIGSGIFYVPHKNYEFSIESYFKKMNNVLNYKEGGESAILSQTIDWENEIIQGNGTSYGLEFFAKKNSGRFNGWLSYTLSWNWRQFDEINNGKRYPFKYDRRHQINVVSNYRWSEKINTSIQWHFSSGNFTTIPSRRIPVSFQSDEMFFSTLFINSAESINTRNNYQYSSNHRLDFSIEFRKKKKKYTRIWAIGMYNVYGRKNPQFIRSNYFPVANNPDEIQLRFEEVNFIRTIPSISYRIEF